MNIQLKTLSTLFLFSLPVLVTPEAFNARQETRNILVLHSYHQGLEWTDGISQGIQKVLRQYDGPVEIYFEYLDTKRNSGEDYFQSLAASRRQRGRSENRKMEALITSDNDALRFVVEYGEEFFDETPVIFCGVNNFEPSLLNNKKNITGITERVDYISTLNTMISLHPERKKVLVVLDGTSTGRAIKTEFEKIVPLFKGKLEFEFFLNFEMNELLNRIRQLGNNEMVYTLSLNEDRNGVFISYTNAIRTIREVSAVPIYGSWDFYLGEGILGGMITSGNYQGEQAGRMAIKILQGEAVEDIPVIDRGTNRYMFDYRELSRFNIKEYQLPAGSSLINKPDFSFRDNQKAQFILSILLVLILLQLLLSIYLKRKKNIALSEVKDLSGLLPICSSCKKVRDDQGYWNQIETYISQHSDVDFSHGLCPECADKLYPAYKKRRKTPSKEE